ncbi:hypothetical protein Patl1_29139 [Pistacia atlantica]|uniref:Uncharacterized protein n=1 Tax=Pistacia atlantica TaxID=434234 RepID=A0ACC1BGJ0_9ROSI|nr:hypothetical protein Patl1_29139 [Pistacia atlantica]
MSSWEHFGEIANVAQLTGIDAVRLIGMIVKAASTARMHKKNCRQFAQHLKLIGNLLEQLRISELKKYPETREPLEQLEDALRRSYILVNSCQDRSYLYLLAMGWNIVYQFRKAQNEIDRYLKIVPLITLVDNARVRNVPGVLRDWNILRRINANTHWMRRTKSCKLLSCIGNLQNMKLWFLKRLYLLPTLKMGFNEILKKENEKLQRELQLSQANMDVNQVEVIQRLIDVTETVAASPLPEESSPKKVSKKVERNYSDADSEQHYSYDEHSPKKVDSRTTSSITKGAESVMPPFLFRNTSSVSSGQDLLSRRGSFQHEEWHSDLLGCCSEPLLCMSSHAVDHFRLSFGNLSKQLVPIAGIKTLFYPCGTLSKIATVANNRHMSSAEACNELMAYSLILSCCCYTCCVRRKLRKTLNITGGFIDDFLSHLMCCCCALVQEWREVEIRGIYGMSYASASLLFVKCTISSRSIVHISGPEKTKTSPPPLQFMES